MTNINKCRVCLADGAEHPIFEAIESKESIYSLLNLCFKERTEDIEGYPRKICESCTEILHTVCNFIRKYQASCELLESSLLVIKKEVDSDSENYVLKQETALTICKNEPDSDWIEELDDSLWNEPLAQDKKQNTSLTNTTANLKNLRKIKLKKKSERKSKTGCKTSKTASSILESEFEWNGEIWCLKSSKVQEPKVEQNKKQTKKRILHKLPRKRQATTIKLCDICGAIYKCKDHMLMHFRKPMICPICSKTFSAEHYLKRHIKISHEDKKFICDTCGAGFALQGILNKHINAVHLKIQKSRRHYPCDICDKTFMNPKVLTIHERSAHTGIRPAVCTECGASFYHEDYLKEHMRLHTGETPFKCPICGRGYAQLGNMKSHMSHNHRLADLSQETLSKLKPTWFKYLKKP